MARKKTVQLKKGQTIWNHLFEGVPQADFEVLSTAQMKIVIDRARALRGLPEISPYTVITYCREREQREADGLPFIPAQMVSGVWVCSVRDFKIALPGIVAASWYQGRRLRREGDTKHKKVTVPDAEKETRKDIEAARQRWRNQNRYRLERIQTVLEHLTGYQDCPHCDGSGCSECIDGLIPFNHPRYLNGQIVRLNDVVVVPEITQLPHVTHGLVLGWDNEGQALWLLALDGNNRSIGKAIEMEIDEVVLLERRKENLDVE